MSDPRRRPNAPAPNKNQNPYQPSRSNRDSANQAQQNPDQQRRQGHRSSGRQQPKQHVSNRSGQSSRDPGVGSSRGRESGRESEGRSRTEPNVKKHKKKCLLSRLFGGWLSDSRGPAPWRTDSRGGGLARRKGESNPKNYGFNIPERALNNPYWQNAPDLPPLNDKAKAARDKKKKKTKRKE